MQIIALLISLISIATAFTTYPRPIPSAVSTHSTKVFQSKGQLLMRKGRRSTRSKAPKKLEADVSKGSWIKLFNSAEEIPAGEGKSKVATGADPFGKEKLFLTVRHKKEYYTLDTNCGRCKFPLLNGEIAEEEGKETSLQCPLCGVGYSLTTGKPTGANKPPGMVGGMMSNLMSATEAKPVVAYPTALNDVGEVYCKFEYI
eukprot:CAMPEP_0117760682 /NCGR_PEP_ID=MMETSP0947-20121206/16786_1 /TAXON_ID=44440 /ORGANISM="Chattonella subsalsa, Strain CCMP2191" /LENGTH=200 /DNA_ID=CAMNT_0005581441 /DNA_START=114 /DNA_END=716 /DNA_ORIENTATION=+